MKAPALSVIVPTRERPDTLFHTLRTLVNQDYDDFEIIVSDNFSQDNTRQIVESFEDPRLRYINTGSRVSMSENWEFALAYAQGEFVTYIGDDDGFMPGALKGAMNILESSQLDAIVWGKAEYCWPDYIDVNMSNLISLKAQRPSLHIVSSIKKLNQVLKFREGYTKLPCLYNGIIRKDLINKVKTKSLNNIFFNAISPDVFSGIALSMTIDRYIYTDYPFSVNGASRHSNGTSFMRHKTDSPGSPHAKFTSENQRKYDQRLLMGPAIPICVMGEYLFAKQFLKGHNFPKVSWKAYINALLRSAKRSLLPEDILKSAAHTKKELGLNIKIPEYLDLDGSKSRFSTGFSGDSLNFIAPIEMVKNVYDACQIIHSMLPEITTVNFSSPLRDFAYRARNFVINELKIFYRSI